MTTGIQVWTKAPPLNGVEQKIRKLPYDTGYTVHEEAIGVDPTDTNGASGTISVDVFAPGSRVAVKRLTRHEITLTDKTQGSTRGIVRTPSGDLTKASVTADQRLVLLAVTRTAQPFTGTVRDYIVYLLGLVGIYEGFVIEGEFAAVTESFPGWNDEVYLQMKRLLIPRGAEIGLASGNIVIRGRGGRVTVDKRDADMSWSMDETGLALAVEGYWYTSTPRQIGLAYPSGGWNEDVQVYQVDAGETIDIPIQVDASLSSVNQPIALDYVDRYYTGPNSVYSVIGADNKPIIAKQWKDAGGDVTVRIDDDTRTLIVSITGARIERYAPFRIAVTAGPSDTYSSLRITGTGVFIEKHGPVTMDTSASPDDTSVEIGATVDNEFITSKAMLWEAMQWTRARYGGPRQSITVRTTGINRIDQSGSYAYATLNDFDLDALSRGLVTIEDFNRAYENSTIADLDAEWVDKATSSFRNQAFGNVIGARTFRDGHWYRVRTSDITPGIITYTAEGDTTVRDFNAWILEQLEVRGLPNTIASFNLLYAEVATVGDFSAAPLSLEH